MRPARLHRCSASPALASLVSRRWAGSASRRRLQGYLDVGHTVSAEARRDLVRLIRRAVGEVP